MLMTTSYGVRCVSVNDDVLWRPMFNARCLQVPTYNVVAQHAQERLTTPERTHVQQYHVVHSKLQWKWLRLTTQLCLKSRLKLVAQNVAPTYVCETFLINLRSTNYGNQFSDATGCQTKSIDKLMKLQLTS